MRTVDDIPRCGVCGRQIGEDDAVVFAAGRWHCETCASGARSTAEPERSPRAGTKAYTAREIQIIARCLRGGLSAAEIAGRISGERREAVSRNAIIGLVARDKALSAIGFCRARPKQAKPAKPAKPAGPARKRTGLTATHVARRSAGREKEAAFVTPVKAVSSGASAIVYDAAALHVPLMDLRAGQCRFAVNDARPGEPHLFCGQPIRRGSYCAHHLERATARVCEAA